TRSGPRCSFLVDKRFTEPWSPAPLCLGSASVGHLPLLLGNSNGGTSDGGTSGNCCGGDGGGNNVETVMAMRVKAGSSDGGDSGSGENGGNGNGDGRSSG